MTDDLMLRRKWTLRAHGRQVVFIKKRNERAAHVLMKAFLWALYLPDYPDLTVEIRIGDRYKPDLVSLTERDEPRFWGEAGQVGAKKIRSLARRYRETHFAIAKWGLPLEPLAEQVRQAIAGLNRSAPFDLLTFPPDSPERFIDERGDIDLQHKDVTWLRLY